MRISLLAGVLLATLVGTTASAQSVPFRVVVHSDNPVSTLTRERVSQLFLKKVTQWQDRSRVLPVEMREAVSLRAEFSRRIHQRDVPTIKTYWQQMIFAGRAVPPPERASDAEVLEFVQKNPSAIGYVSATAPLPAGVKIVDISG
jgi:ABC-type phosphate transport system substrate-binding protein